MTPAETLRALGYHDDADRREALEARGSVSEDPRGLDWTWKPALWVSALAAIVALIAVVVIGQPDGLTTAAEASAAGGGNE
jgi:hypothetical protein